jgi:hypothetical protein
MNQITAEEIYEQTKKNHEAKTTEEKQEEKMRFCRGIRNNLLKKTDNFMNQTDRYSQKQIDQLKAYRQSLRDLPNLNNDISQLDKIIEFPPEPEFIQESFPEPPLRKI